MAVDAVVLAEVIRRANPVGTVQFVPDSGQIINLSDGSEWLRTGLAKSITGYTKAAAVEHLKVSGLSSNYVANNATKQIATDGAGNFVAAFGDATNVKVSTDGGATWSNVAHNAGGAVHAVAYGGGRFVAIGQSGTTWSAASCATANGTWVVGTGLTGITSGTTATTHMVYGGGKFVAVCVGGNGAIAVSSNGTSWTCYNPPSALAGTPAVAYANAKWIISNNTTSTWAQSSDAITWSALTTGAINSPVALLSNGTLLVCFGIGTIYTSTDTGATWTSRVLRGNSSYALANFPGQCVYDGQKFIIPGLNAPLVFWSSDGSTWRMRWLSINPSATAMAVGSDGTRAVFHGGTDNSLYTASWNTPDYIGTGVTQYSGTMANGTPVGYIKIKD